MKTTLASLHTWFEALFGSQPERILYGFAELEGLLPAELESLPNALSFAVRMDDLTMDSIITGPTRYYFGEYTRINEFIAGLETKIVGHLTALGYWAYAIHPSKRVDFVNIAGEFPHKTAASLAGLGWIGKNCQLVTPEYGPRVRLGTILTNMPLGGQAARRLTSRCGKCTRCADICPAKALSGTAWTETGGRASLLDAVACDLWKQEHFGEFGKGAVCGICTSICPHGRRGRKTGLAV